MVTTIAGCMKAGFVDGDALTEARFNGPRFLTIDGGIVYVCDSGNSAIRKIEDGMVSTLVERYRY